MGVLLQPCQKSHGPAVVEIRVDSFDGLVVIDPDSPHLSIKIRQAQIVVVRVLVGLNDPERSAEDTGEDKFRLAALARL